MYKSKIANNITIVLALSAALLLSILYAKYFSNEKEYYGNAGCLIFNENGDFLLAKGAKDGKMRIPGGTSVLNPKETAKETAKREAMEELGIQVEVGEMFFHSVEPDFYIFLCKTSKNINTKYKYSDEINGVAWFNVKGSHDSQLRYPKEYKDLAIAVENIKSTKKFSDYVYKN